MDVSGFIKQYESTIREIAQLRPDQPINLHTINSSNFVLQMNSYHFDWWAFPIDEYSSQSVYGATRSKIEELRSSEPYMKLYRWFSIRIASSFGVSLDSFPANSTSNTGASIRLYKVLKSWLLFGLDDWFMQMAIELYPRTTSDRQDMIRHLLLYRCMMNRFPDGVTDIREVKIYHQSVPPTGDVERCSLGPLSKSVYYIPLTDTMESVPIRNQGSECPFDPNILKSSFNGNRWLPDSRFLE